jgi:F-box/leucine-rich repeat protein 7
MGEAGILRDGQIISSKKRKSPSPSLADAVQASGLGSASFNVRHLLKELPLFASLPPEILHFIGMNAQPRTFPPFTEIIKQGSTGRDVFCIVRGEVEVINDMPIKLGGNLNPGDKSRIGSIVKARLKAGQYFGEVVSLSLAKRRTATVRSVSSVECLMITGSVLDELWDKCTPDLRRQVERTARDRLETARQRIDGDMSMTDVDNTPTISRLELDDIQPKSPTEKVPKVTFASTDGGLARIDEAPAFESVDPDPYLNVDLENVRSRSRRGSLAPPSPSNPSPPSDPATGEITRSPHRSNSINRSSWPAAFRSEPVSPVRRVFAPRRSIFTKPRPQDTIGIFSNKILVNIFQHLDVYELMKLRLISHHWKNILTNNHSILHTLDLTAYNRFVTDEVLTSIICPFVGTRPQHIDISNCFHVTDEGFTVLASTCAGNIKSWKMKSVWDITCQAVLDMVNKAKGLEDIDLSNCRKVGDNLLARVVGWFVPEILPSAVPQNQQLSSRKMGQKANTAGNHNQTQPAPGTVVGCPHLKRLTLSYCKHITDRSMAHIAVHASSRLEEMDLTRCTTITDGGFQHWSIYPFPRLRKLVLADCTYLTDHAIICLTNAAKALKELDLVSF